MVDLQILQGLTICMWSDADSDDNLLISFSVHLTDFLYIFYTFVQAPIDSKLRQPLVEQVEQQET